MNLNKLIAVAVGLLGVGMLSMVITSQITGWRIKALEDRVGALEKAAVTTKEQQ